MILLFTDFGHDGPYVGQMKTVLASEAPAIPVIDLMHDAPAHDPRAAAYLLAALVPEMPEGAICCAVVDPGVGGDRSPVVLEADGRRFVGPDNGLFEIVQRRARHARQWMITWRPDRLTRSFHGRDLFAPVAARIALGHAVPGDPMDTGALLRTGWPEELAKIIYIDHFGNAMTGLSAQSLPPGTVLRFSRTDVKSARVFSDVENGAPFWYENANGLAEIAVNRGRADAFGLTVGTPVTVVPPDYA